MQNVPSKIGRYEIVERVGQGGMGVLYRARDPVLDREVAVKMMLVDFAAEEGARERFEREARAAAKLQHRNVVTIHELGEVDNAPYIVMEFLGGRDLDELMRRYPPISLDEKLDIMIQLCAGLGYAHERGIVHRDIKPSNVRVLEDGTAKILDFGIAKVARTGTTSRGLAVGSPSYMAPEVLTGEVVDGRADIFSTGVVLYELLSGRKPFGGESPTAVVYQILNREPPPIQTVMPDLPPLLTEIVTRALEKDPAKRYARVSEMAGDLQIARLQVAARPPAAVVSEAEVDAAAPTVALRPPQQPATVKTVTIALPTFRRWTVVGSAVSVLIVLALVGLWMRPWGARPQPAPEADRRAPASSVAGTPPEASQPTATTGPPPAPVGAPAPPAKLLVESVPPGARVFLGGRDTGLVTPATVALDGTLLTSLRLTRAGYQPQEIELTEADLRAGRRAVSLVAAGPGTVVLEGEYSFEVLQGSRVVSPSSSSHQLTLPAQPTTLRLRSTQYFLDRSVQVVLQPGRRVQVQAPALGTLAVFAAMETCMVRIDGQDAGFPPVPSQLVAAGSHRVALRCPGGSGSVKEVGVEAGQRTAVTFDVVRE